MDHQEMSDQADRSWLLEKHPAPKTAPDTRARTLTAVLLTIAAALLLKAL